MAGSTTVKAINVTMSANIQRYEAGLSRSQQIAHNLQGTFTALGSSISGLASRVPILGSLSDALGGISAGGVALGAMAAATAGAAASLNIFRERVGVLDEVAKTARGLGIAASDLQSLQFAAQRTAGAGPEEMAGALTRMTKLVGEAAAGGKSQIQTLDALGLSLGRLGRLDTRGQFYAIAEAISRLRNPTQQAQVTLDIFGKSAINIGGAIMEGTAGFREAEARFRELGGAISDVDFANIEAAADAMDDLGAAWVGLKSKLAVKMAPGITDFLNDMLSGKAVSGLKTNWGVKVNPSFMADALTPKAPKWGVEWTKGAAKAKDLGSATKKAGFEKLFDSAESKKFREDMDKKIAEWEKAKAKRVTDIRKDLFDETPLMRYEKRVKEINDLYWLGSIALKERNALLSAAMREDIIMPGIKRYQKALKPMAERAKSISESVATPYEKAVKNVREIRRLQDIGLLTQVAAARAIRSEAQAYVATLPKMGPTQGPAALERGSQEAFSAFQQARRGDASEKERLALERKMERHLADIKRGGVVLAEAKI